jgi:hypothetical protein
VQNYKKKKKTDKQKDGRQCRKHLEGLQHVCVSLYLAILRGTLLVAQLVEALRCKPEGRGFDSK